MSIQIAKKRLLKVCNQLKLRGKSRAWSIWRPLKHPMVLHCLGDSHAQVFEFIARNRIWRKTEFSFCIVQGATATGLANPNSQTQSYPIFQEYLGKANKRDHLLFCMGEVDCGFVIWYRAQKTDETVQSQMELAVRNYTQFVDWCIKQGFKHITLCSAPMPTIMDGQDWGEVASKRKEVKATLRERTDLTRAFNRAIKAYCRARRLTYLDFEPETLDPRTQVVSNAFLNKNRLDHHLDSQALSTVLMPKLMHIGYI